MVGTGRTSATAQGPAIPIDCGNCLNLANPVSGSQVASGLMANGRAVMVDRTTRTDRGEATARELVSVVTMVDLVKVARA